MYILYVRAVWRLVKSLTNFKANLKIIRKELKGMTMELIVVLKQLQLEYNKSMLRKLIQVINK